MHKEFLGRVKLDKNNVRVVDTHGEKLEYDEMHHDKHFRDRIIGKI